MIYKLGDIKTSSCFTRMSHRFPTFVRVLEAFFDTGTAFGTQCQGASFVKAQLMCHLRFRPQMTKQPSLHRCSSIYTGLKLSYMQKASKSLWKGSISLKASISYHIHVPVVSLFEVSTHAVDDNLEDDPALPGMSCLIGFSHFQ